MPMFDSSPACMHGLCFWLPVPIRRLVGPGYLRGLPVLARVVSRRAHGSRTTPGLMAARDIVPISIAFPLEAHGRRPKCVFSKLNSRPVDASVYTSPGASRHPAQDSRSGWFATPFSWGSFIPDYTPVYPDDCASLRARLCRISALPSRDCEGAVTKINCFVLHRFSDNFFPHNRLTLIELANLRRSNCRF
jgi:hypothetical protein